MKKVAMLAVAAALLGISAPNFAQVPGSSQPSSTQQDDRDLDVGTSGSQSGSQTGTGTMTPGSDSIRKAQQPGTSGSQSGSGTGTSGTGTGTSGSMSQYSQEVEVSELPAAITMKISEKYVGFEADKAYKANDGSFKVMLKKDDAEKQTVYFDQKGEVIKAKSGTHMDKDKAGSGTGASGSVSGTSGSVSGTSGSVSGTGTGTSGSVSGTGTGTSGSVSGTSGSVSGTGTGTSAAGTTSGSTGAYGTMPQQPGTSDSKSETGTSGTSTQKEQDKKQSTGTSGSGTSTSGSGTGTSATGTGSSVGSSSSSMSSEYNEEVKASDLPAAITRSMNEKYPGYKTEKAHKAKDGTYKVTVSKDDEKQTLFFDARGESVKMQK